MVRRLDTFSHDAMAAVASKRAEGLEDGLGRAVGRARADERQVDLEDVVLDFAEQPETRVASAYVVDRYAHVVAAQRRDRLLQTTQVVDAFAFGDLDDELGR